MVLFNCSAWGPVPILILIAMQIRRMAHRTPIFFCRHDRLHLGAPTLFLVANVCWLLAFRPDRDPGLTVAQRPGLVDVHYQVPYLIAQSVLVALAIFFDDGPRPCFPEVGGVLPICRRPRRSCWPLHRTGRGGPSSERRTFVLAQNITTRCGSW